MWVQVRPKVLVMFTSCAPLLCHSNGVGTNDGTPLIHYHPIVTSQNAWPTSIDVCVAFARFRGGWRRSASSHILACHPCHIQQPSDSRNGRRNRAQKFPLVGCTACCLVRITFHVHPTPSSFFTFCLLSGVKEDPEREVGLKGVKRQEDSGARYYHHISRSRFEEPLTAWMYRQSSLAPVPDTDTDKPLSSSSCLAFNPLETLLHLP
jgi:hypothetical protein